MYPVCSVTNLSGLDRRPVSRLDPTHQPADRHDRPRDRRRARGFPLRHRLRAVGDLHEAQPGGLVHRRVDLHGVRGVRRPLRGEPRPETHGRDDPQVATRPAVLTFLDCQEEAMPDLTRDQLRQFARLGAQARLAQMDAEVAVIKAAYPDLAGRLKPGRPARPVVAVPEAPVAAKRPRRVHRMSAAERRAVSVRMKRYWAARRKAKGR